MHNVCFNKHYQGKCIINKPEFCYHFASAHFRDIYEEKYKSVCFSLLSFSSHWTQTLDITTRKLKRKVLTTTILWGHFPSRLSQEATLLL